MFLVSLEFLDNCVESLVTSEPPRDHKETEKTRLGASLAHSHPTGTERTDLGNTQNKGAVVQYQSTVLA